MITPRTTRLLRVPDLRALHRTIAERLSQRRADTAVLVPTAAAGAALQRTLARIIGGASGAAILTRDDLYARLHDSHARAVAFDGAPTDSDRPVPAMLSAFEREVLLAKAAEHAQESGAAPPFRLRPGLLVEILGFYDELRRRDRTVADFERLMSDSLQSSVEIDRGAERLHRQTQFLTATFSAFESLVRASGRLDEHALRGALLEIETAPAFRYLMLAVADQAADPRGLWTADYDLLARLHGIEAIDVLATENVLASGFHQRIHDVLPGIEEVRSGPPSEPPVLSAPERTTLDNPINWFV